MENTYTEEFIIPRNWSKSSAMIKVIGVGGGGCNAVNHMYNSSIEGCSFAVCNTDTQVLEQSPVPVKIQLGNDGLGAGTDPDRGRRCALESQKEIEEKILDDKTKMVFITAGMGGGTGTGATPVIASAARQKGILTVAVVTLPFKDEGNGSMSKALEGVHELQRCVDSLLIINNEKIYDVYGDLMIQDAFPKTDEVLATAVKGIIEIITVPGYINVDFRDVCNMMKSSGFALMGSGEGTGPERIRNAVEAAISSPLLLDCELSTADNVIVNITVSKSEKGITASELKKIDTLISDHMGHANRFKKGIVYNDDEDFADKVRVTVIATGLKMETIDAMLYSEGENIIVIDENFVYEKPKVTGEIKLGAPRISKRGLGMSRDRIFHFDAPTILNVTDLEEISKLENASAIGRTTKK